ncbi:hypothetical protein D3791_00010 [Glutamicibacter mishrai]|uniref:Shikimate kinase n=1 Tax=Glutamicibacter mishrai TaxID=1775880 RepID=A0A6H0SDP6_9MICC|nr:shikimate kinase [Glutamicibacter mishrai]QIV85643.1 hypothetical protein D3791_00010 [Glutamicibacter mishrai]
MIYLIGPMASGKSTVGRSLATALSTSFADSDAAVVAHHGTIPQILPSMASRISAIWKSRPWRACSPG